MRSRFLIGNPEVTRSGPENTATAVDFDAEEAYIQEINCSSFFLRKPWSVLDPLTSINSDFWQITVRPKERMTKEEALDLSTDITTDTVNFDVERDRD